MDGLFHLTLVNKDTQTGDYQKLKAQMEDMRRRFAEQMKEKSKYEQDFMKLFKMQMELRQSDFEKLKIEYKLRFLCFFFFNYVNRILVLYYYKDFLPEIKLYQKFNNINPK